MAATGRITEVVDTSPWRAVACALGGEERRTLLITLAPELRAFPEGPPELTARVDAVEVDVPGAGWP
jgi:hypothetical protein